MTDNVKLNREAEVNLLAAAKDAQWSATTFLGPGSLKLVAPAKVNLLLSVGQRRADGYHEVENIMHALALHDVVYLHVEPLGEDELARAAAELAEGSARAGETHALGGPSDNLLVEIDLSDRTGQDLRVPASGNLAFKAADRLARAVDRTAPEKVSLRIEKHIPAQGGLGGGSSDAAAVLVGLASAWGLASDDARLGEVAQGLGADVAFFLKGGCQMLEGAGEHSVHTLVPSRQPVVLVRPDAGVSTAECYRRFDERPVPVSAEALEVARPATEATQVPLTNNLAPAAESLLPELARVRQWLAERAGEENVLLCGSGSTTFALFDSFDAASAVAVEAGKCGWWARPTNLSGLRAAVVPGR